MSYLIRIVFVAALEVYCGRAVALDYNFLLAPLPQADSYDCQSYQLAVALSMADDSGRFQILKTNEFRDMEANIRNLVVKSMGVNSSSTPEDWKHAVEQITFGEYSVDGKDFTTYEDLYHYLDSHVTIHNKDSNKIDLIVNRPSVVYLVSVTELDGNTYRDGHILSVLGKDDTSKLPYSYQPSLLTINSADKYGICTLWGNKTKYFGLIGWSKNYSLKRARLNWIVRK